MESGTRPCLFCKIVTGEADATVVLDSESAVAIRDINPQAPTHLLVIPKVHYEAAADLAAADPELLARLFQTAHEAARGDGIAESGYRLVLNTGPDALQTVFHVHLHVLGGRRLGWPPG